MKVLKHYHALFNFRNFIYWHMKIDIADTGMSELCLVFMISYG